MARDRDGKVDGCGAHLITQIHQNYIYVWNSSHRIPAEGLQKISYNENCKKNPHIAG